MLTDYQTVKISGLPQVISPQSNDELPMNNQGETRKANPGQLSSDYSSLVVAPRVVQQNGQRSTDISFDGVDYSGSLSKGMRLSIPRSILPSTQCADLDGISQYAGKAAPTGITFTDDWTIEAWVFLDSYNKGYILSRFNTAMTTGWGLNIESTGQLRFINLSGSTEYITSDVSVPKSKWVHVAATMDLSGNLGDFYINGALVVSNRTGTAATATTQAGDIRIGAEGTPANFLDGRISDVRLWSTIRTQAQIRDNMNQQLTGSESGLVGYWKLAGNFNDSTTNANNLTPGGSAIANYADNPFNARAFGIISSTPTFAGGNTTMTVQTPSGYPIPSQTLDSSSYSTVKAPYGFPVDPSLWSIKSVCLIERVKSIGSLSTWYDNNQDILIPKGEWYVHVMLMLQANGSTATSGMTASAALAPTGTLPVGSPTIETSAAIYFPTSATTVLSAANFNGRIVAAAATTYTLQGMVSTAAGSVSFRFRGDFTPTVIEADFGLL